MIPNKIKPFLVKITKKFKTGNYLYMNPPVILEHAFAQLIKTTCIFKITTFKLDNKVTYKDTCKIYRQTRDEIL